MNKVVYNKREKIVKRYKKNETMWLVCKWIDSLSLGTRCGLTTDIVLRLFLLISFNLAYFTYKLYIETLKRVLRGSVTAVSYLKIIKL